MRESLRQRVTGITSQEERETMSERETSQRVRARKSVREVIA